MKAKQFDCMALQRQGKNLRANQKYDYCPRACLLAASY